MTTEHMDVTIEIPQEASAVVIRAVRESNEKSSAAQAGEAEYDSWKADVAEYDSWSAAFNPRVGRSRA
jgi:hypothetical protein